MQFNRKGVAPFTAVDGVSFEVAPGPDRRAGRRIRLRQVGDVAGDHAAAAQARVRRSPGAVDFEGTDLLSLPLDDMRDRRGRDLAMIFQDPLSSLNPVVPIGIQVTEVLERHRGMKRSAAMSEARDLLDSVGIPDPTRRLKEYPHQLSGGMRQRALIAMALACRPRLLIADEPTTALDVTIQAQILALLKTLVVEHGTALIMITHDLGVVAGLVRRGERALRRPGGRAGRPARAVRLAPAPVHARAAGVDPAAGRRAGGAADADPRVRVGQHPVDGRVRVRAAVLPGDRRLPRR